MSDTEILKKVATLWIELGGDAEGVTWCWQELRDEVERQLFPDNVKVESPSQ
jgi:hypothetical protein